VTVAGDETVCYGGFQGLVQDDVELVHGRRRKAGVQTILVEPPRMSGREVLELDAPQRRPYVGRIAYS
jgi:hypothetical protein